MPARPLAIWFVLLLAAIVNGAVREAMLVPRVGDTAGHIISSITLSLLILGIATATIRWMGADGPNPLLIGTVWLTLTIAFEFLAGHYVFGTPWRQLLADYNLAAGRIWILVLVTTLLAPTLAMRIRHVW